MAEKRILKDLHILDTNKQDLEKRNVYYHINQDNIYELLVLIIPNEEPYKGGAFLFEFKLPTDYPLSPPKVIFNPKQSFARLHPNFYENGKVCLSVINTWGGEDWTASMNILNIIIILEARFDNNPICYEPGNEHPSVAVTTNYNETVRYGVYLSLCNILEKKYKLYECFYDIIKQYHKDICEIIKTKILLVKKIRQPHYYHIITIDYQLIYDRLYVIK